MPKQKRVMIQVEVGLDPFPGAFHTRADAEKKIMDILMQAIPHCQPNVLIEPDTD